MGNGTSTTAVPAAIGTINLGVEPVIRNTANGVIISGCDYVATCSPLSSSNTSWATIAGFAVAPYSMGNNTLSDLCRNYAEYRVQRFAVAFVPSVGTSANGQVALFVKPTRSTSNIDPNGSTFFPYVLNQRTGAIGPVWQPLTVQMNLSGVWKSTVPLDGTDIDDECDGEVFVATNNNVASGIAPSIGIVKVFYSIEFRGMSRNPRLALIPVANQIYQNWSIGFAAVSASVGTSVTMNIFGTDQSGNTAFNPSGIQNGDIMKFAVDVGRSSFGSSSKDTLFGVTLMGSIRAVPFAGVTTVYVLYTTGGMNLFLSFVNAMTQTDPMVYNNATTSETVALKGMCSLVGNSLLRNSVTI